MIQEKICSPNSRFEESGNVVMMLHRPKKREDEDGDGSAFGDIECLMHKTENKIFEDDLATFVATRMRIFINNINFYRMKTVILHAYFLLNCLFAHKKI